MTKQIRVVDVSRLDDMLVRQNLRVFIQAQIACINNSISELLELVNLLAEEEANYFSCLRKN